MKIKANIVQIRNESINKGNRMHISLLYLKESVETREKNI